jgi:hypothetical protein
MSHSHIQLGVCTQPVNQPANWLTVNRFGPVLNYPGPVNQLVDRFRKILDRPVTGRLVNVHCENSTERRGTIVGRCEPFTL